MAFINAIIAGAAIGLIFQLIVSNANISFIRLFRGSLIVGAILTGLGIMGQIVGFGFAGAIISVVDAGEAMYGGFIGAFNGDPTSIIVFMIMLLSIFLGAVLIGLAKRVEVQQAGTDNHESKAHE